jgi:hypothetical protein
MLWQDSLLARVIGLVKRWRSTELIPLITSRDMRAVGHH